jgi:hypothetical protein
MVEEPHQKFWWQRCMVGSPTELPSFFSQRLIAE